MVVTYFMNFFYDLVEFGSHDTDDFLAYTHSRNVQLFNQNKDEKTVLQLTYVFHYWSRPFAEFMRNILCLSLMAKDNVITTNENENSILPNNSNKKKLAYVT